MEEVEANINYGAKLYSFEGQADISQVKFNTPHAMRVYELITNAANKQAVVNITKSYFVYNPQLLQLSASESSGQSVCAKIIVQGQTIVECLNCRMDQSCIICLNCFKNGNHEGHKVLYKKAYGGCCDCGDAEAWSPQGFCKQHSGEAQDISIDQKDVHEFSLALQDLFYLYYRLKLARESQKSENMACQLILKVFEKIIEQGPKGIKLLALLLQNKLPNNLRFNQSLQGQSILTHIFTWRFVGRDLRAWQNIFIKMFPYYQFKKVLLATYIECFPILYVSEEACMTGQSLACQILTSYKLVEDYVDSQNSQPIGYNAKDIANPQHMNCLSNMLCVDLQKIINLQDPVPEKYMRLQVSKGMHLLFASHRLLNRQMEKQKQIVAAANKQEPQPAKKAKKNKKKEAQVKKEQDKDQGLAFFNPTFFMIRNIRSIVNEFTSLQLLNSLLRIINRDRISLLKALKQFADLIDADSDNLIIFRPYDRAFALTLFALCNQNLNILLQNNFRRELMELLGRDEESFENWLRKIEQRMLATYFFYSHILCNEDRGYHSSFFNYIYLYRSKDKFLISADTLQLKMVALLSKNRPTLNFPRLMKFEDFDEQKWTLFILITLYQELQLLYVGTFSQIYISHFEISDKYNKESIREDVIHYLAKFVAGQGSSVSLEKAAQFSKSFLFENNDYLKKCLVQCCSYVKERKLFELKEQYRAQLPFNYKDFELRLKDDKFANKNIEQSRVQLTHCLIDGYNRVIFSHYWNDDNIETFKQVLINLYEQTAKTEVQDNLVELATIICKFCASLRTFGTAEQQLIVDQILLRTAISPEVKQKLTQFKDIVGGEEEGQPDTKLKEKKELLMMKKMKKMEEIRRKKEENMTTIRQVHKIQEETHQAQQYCAICRKKDSKKYQLVYLANLCISNLQKLAKLGPGVQTASLATCYHVFDYECLEKQSKNEYEAILRCPICRKVGNIFLPAYPLIQQEKSHPFVKACIERTTQVIMTIHSYREIDPIEQLFKSFYHYILLSQFDQEYVRKNRLRLYRIILQLFFHFEIQQHLEELVEKFTRNEITLNPKLLKKDRVNIINLRAGQAMIEDEEDSEMEDDEENQEFLMIETLPRSVMNVMKKASSKEKSKKVSLSPEFKYIGLRILRTILDNSEAKKKSNAMVSEQQNGEKQQKGPIIADNTKTSNALKQAILPQVSVDIQLAVDELLGLPTQSIQKKFNCSQLQFIKLPLTFNWDMSKNECDLCQQPCHDLFVCLLCPWKGCINCKPGGVNKHFPAVHGETSAFMRVNDGFAYIIGTKMIKKIDCLYLNEWGEPLRLKKEWNSYCLQGDVLEKAKNMLLRDQ